MKKIILTILLFTFTQSLFSQAVNKEEYEVYATVLRKTYKSNIVILNKTKIAEVYEESKSSEEDSTLKEYNESKEWKSILRIFQISKTDKDFEAKNKTSVKLQKLFPIKYKYWLVDEKEINNLIELGEKDFETLQEEQKKKKQPLYDGGAEIIWKPFDKKYPNAFGYFKFSRVGFSPNKRFARVDVEGKGYEWFNYKSFILKKIRGKWIIYTSWGYENIS